MSTTETRIEYFGRLQVHQPIHPPMAIATRPQDWEPEARSILWPVSK
jgi:hypothetical protein